MSEPTIFWSIGIFYLLAIAALFMALKIVLAKNKPVPENEIITLTNTDTIYKEIDILTLKRDTISKYYEKKIHNYRTLPTPKRVKLFADRINRQ